MNCKKSIGRTSVQHPTRVTSDILRRELRSLGLLGNGPPKDPDCVAKHLDADKEYLNLYDQHPIVPDALAAGLPKERIIPVAVYFDGVQYTKNENFLGFYVTNLRTKRQQLVWLLRAFGLFIGPRA